MEILGDGGRIRARGLLVGSFIDGGRGDGMSSNGASTLLLSHAVNLTEFLEISVSELREDKFLTVMISRSA